MGLLFNRKKKEEQPKSVPFFEQSFIQAKSFRGFKRVGLSNYGYKPIEEGLNALRPFDLKGREITLQGVESSGLKLLQVLVDGNHVGTLFEYNYTDIFKAILAGKATAAYVKAEDDGDKVFLFVKLGD